MDDGTHWIMQTIIPTILSIIVLYFTSKPKTSEDLLGIIGLSVLFIGPVIALIVQLVFN